MEAIKSYASGLKKKVESGNKQTEGLGSELAARAEMNRVGESAISNRAAAADPERATPSSSPQDKVGSSPYGSRPGEKRIDISKLPDGTPAPKYHKGVAVVPKTGPAILKKGEAVIPAEKNPMNPFAKITDGDKKPRKALKSMHVTATDNKKHIVTHKHHHPEHHPDTTHAMDTPDEVGQHVAQNAPNIEPQAPSMDDAGAPGAQAAPTPGM
jgi:hypothetical protein